MFMVSKDEAIHKALKVLNCLNNDRVYETAWVKGAINACEEALEQPEIGDAEIKQMLNDIEYYQKRIEALEQPAFGECGNKSCGGHGACYCEEQPVMAISQMNNDALKNALNNQGKLSVNSPQPQPAQEPVATIQQFEHKWIDKEALEQPAEPRLVSYALDGSTCTLNIDGEEVYFNREQPEGKEFFERGKKIARWADKTEQEPVGVVSWHEGAVMGSIFPSSNMPKDGDKLYTHLHQWQELTDDEIIDMYFQANINPQPHGFIIDFIRAIEQELKEKNHG